MKTIVVFQGGGALGAFGAGAWEVLAADASLHQGPLVAVAGASIGALNAAVVAHHHQDADHGAAAMLSLWRDRIATPSWPFLGAWPLPVLPSNGNADHWNGFITGMLLGNRGLFSAAWPAWQPLSGLARLQQPLHDRTPMWRLLGKAFGLYVSQASQGSQAPLLAVAAVDVMAGTLRLFDSDSAAVTARELAASSAIPLLFDPVEIDGRLYWDGEVTRDSLLPGLLQALLHSGRVLPGEPLRLVTVEQFARPSAARPQSGAEISYRALNMMQLGKLDTPALDGINIALHQRIVRQPLAEDGVSGQFDYGPARIARLLDEGRQAARQTGDAMPASAAEPATAEPA